VLELSHDASKYFDVHHTVNDTLAKVDAKALDQTVAAYALAAYLAATKQGDFGRLPTEEEKPEEEPQKTAEKK
jgi:carboxypeptidase Q